jgi:uncharacterized membrane protein (DUF485 family)
VEHRREEDTQMSEASLAAGTSAQPECAAEAVPAARTEDTARTRGRPRRHHLLTLGRFVGFAAAAITLVLFVLLHVLMARLSPLTATLSDYALSPDRGIFNAGVLTLAAGSVFLLGPLALARHGSHRDRHRQRPGRDRRRRQRDAVAVLAGVFFACWFVGLVVLTVFHRDPPGVPATASGEIHQWASVVALVGLPLGAVLTAWRHRHLGTRRVFALAALCLAVLVPFVTAYLAGSPLRPYLGLLERVVALVEIALLLALGTVSLIARVPAPRPARG